MPKARLVNTALNYALCALVFFIPFPFLFGSYTIVLIILLWLLNADFKGTFSRFAERKMLWVWVVYYVLNAASYFYSDNKGDSVFDIGAKISMLVLPFVVGAGMNIDRRHLERLMVFFTASISCIAVFCIIHAVVRCYQEGYVYTPFFFYHRLVDGLDASAVYMALYCMFSISVMLLLPWQHYYTGTQKIVKISFVILQLIFFILLSSRLLILLFFILLVPFYLRKSLKYRSWGVGRILMIGLLFIAVGIGVLGTENPVKKRYNDMFQKDVSVAWLKDYSNVPQDSFNNATLRLMLWRFGIENMNEHKLWLTGAGNGDVTDLQNAKLKQYGFDTDVKDDNKTSEFYNINLHNMFLQVLLMIGLPGLLLYIILSLSPLFALRGMEFRHIFFIFHVSMLFFMFQEAILQTQAGIVYYSVFCMIFWNLKYGIDK